MRCYSSTSNKVSPLRETNSDSFSNWVTNGCNHRLHIRSFEPVKEVNMSASLFFIHGVAGSGHIWTHQAKYFAQRGYHVFCVDLIGHGNSDQPKEKSNYTFQSIKLDMAMIFDKFQKDYNAVIGHSYGTSFAIWLSRARPNSVHALALLGGGSPDALLPSANSCVSPFRWPATLITCLKPCLLGFFTRLAFHDTRLHTNETCKLAFDAPSHVIRNIMEGQVWLQGDAGFHQLIKQPVLLLHGANDQIEEAEGTIITSQTVPNGEYHEITDASHMLMMEQPDVVNELLYKFCDKHRQTMPSRTNRVMVRDHSARITENPYTEQAERRSVILEDNRHTPTPHRKGQPLTEKHTKSMPNLRLF